MSSVVKKLVLLPLVLLNSSIKYFQDYVLIIG